MYKKKLWVPLFIICIIMKTIAVENSIKKIQLCQNKMIGAFVMAKELKDTLHTNNIVSTCNAITVGYDVWKSRIQKEKFTYDYADSVIDFGIKHGMTIRAEVLTGDVLLPSWLRNRTFSHIQLAEILKNEITATTNHYKGKVYAWDVLNELFNDDGSFRNYKKGGFSDDGGKFRNSIWYEMLGESYFDTAFVLVHRIDPHARLFLADYNCEEINTKSNAMFSFVKKLKQKGIPINGISFQCHLILEKLPEWESFRKNIERFANIGLEIHFSEVDIRIKNPVTQAKLEAQAQAYEKLMRLFLSQKACTMFIMWGINDKYSWIPEFTKNNYGSACIFDSTSSPKPAYNAIAKALEQFQANNCKLMTGYIHGKK